MASTKTAAARNGSGGAGAGSWSDQEGRAGKNAAHLEAMEKAVKEAVGAPIVLPPLDIVTINLRVVGTSPLITHRFSEKAIRMMLDKQTGRATAGRAKKDPDEDYRQSLYVHEEGGYGFPTIAFKNAAVTACTSLGRSTISKVAARQAFHITGELCRLEGEPKMRQDMVRLSGGVADVRFRGEFWPWATTLTIRYNARVLTPEQLANLLNTAGFAVGVGEWRAERDGSFGMFEVA